MVRLLLLALAVPAIAMAQDATVNARRTARVAAGSPYAAGGLHRFFFGSFYRDLWTAPMDVPVLDLARTGGGLQPTTAGGGQQTKSLWFNGADGYRYGFRSVDKDPEVPDGFEGTFIEDIVQDQTSSAHPAGPGVVAPLLEALGILHTPRQLVVLPDGPELGRHRERFRGTLGYFERRAVVEPGVPPFAGAAEVIDSDDLFPRLRAGSADRVDPAAYLQARLLDLYIGDWDRHRGQWGWARFGDGVPRRWVPVPEDRDQAFVRFDGFMLGLARFAAPQLTNFDETYADPVGQTWNGREMDRWLLAGLDWAVWDSIVHATTGRLTDAVLAAAVARMPEAYQALDGGWMLRTLRVRRDGLREAAREWYALLARAPELHGTDAADVLTLEWLADGGLVVALGEPGEAPWLTRRFHPGETFEVRCYLHEGDDRVEVRGTPSRAAGILVRIIPGAGADDLVNGSPVPVMFYSEDGDRASGPHRRDARPWDGIDVVDGVPDRDWGSDWWPILWGGSGPDIGLFLGGGAYRTDFGFRHVPYATKVRLRAGWATAAQTGRAQLSAELHRSNSPLSVAMDVLASGIEVLRFHGFGNGTPGPASVPDDDFFRVNYRQLSADWTLRFPVGPDVRVAAGPGLVYSDTENQPDRFLATLPGLYGTGEFARLRLAAEATLDTRDVPAAARSGVYIRGRAAAHPAVLDVVRPYTVLEGVASTYLSVANAPFLPTVAVRAGGRAALGTVPFQDAAFLGGRETIRVGHTNRYAGDHAVWGNAELRLDVARATLLLPARLGVFGLADAGRVFFGGDPAGADRLHTAVGGGLWIAWLDRGGTVTISVTRSDEGRAGLYGGAGFAF